MGRLHLPQGERCTCRNPVYKVYYEGTNRGASGALYLQSAIAGVMSRLGEVFAEQPGASSVDVGVFMQRKLTNRVRAGMQQH